MGAFKYEKVPDSVLKKSWSLRGTTKKKHVSAAEVCP